MKEGEALLIRDGCVWWALGGEDGGAFDREEGAICTGRGARLERSR